MVASSAKAAQTVKAEPVDERASLLQRLASPNAIKARAPDQNISPSRSKPGVAPTSTGSGPQAEEGSPATNKPVVPGTAAAGGQILTGGVNPQKIYIGNLPQSATLADLEDCFGQFGPCTCAIKRGFGFAEFANPEHAMAAVAKYHQGHFLGSQITVQLSHERIYLGKKSDNSKNSRTPPSPTKSSQGLPAPASRPAASDKPRGSHTKGKDMSEPTPKAKPAPIAAATLEPIETLPPLRFVMSHVGPPAQAVSMPPQISPGVYERSDRYVPQLPGATPPVPHARAVGSADEVRPFTSVHPEAYPPAPAYNPGPVPRFDHPPDAYADLRTSTASTPRALGCAYRANLDANPYQQSSQPPVSSYDRNPLPQSIYSYGRALSAPALDTIPYPPTPDNLRFSSRSNPLPAPLRARSPPPSAAYYAQPPPARDHPREPTASRQYSYQEPEYPPLRDHDGFDHYDPRRPAASHPYESHAYLPTGLTQALPHRDREEGRHDARAGPVRDYARDAARYQPYGRSLPPPPSHLSLNPSTSTVRDSPFGAVGTPVPHAPDPSYARFAGDERRYVDPSYGARSPVDHDWPDWGASYVRR